MATKKKGVQVQPNPGLVVRGVPFQDMPGMVTVGPDSAAWRDYEVWLSTPLTAQGAFCRVRPPAGASDEDVQRVRSALVVNGARAVRVLPRPRSAPLVREAREPGTVRETLRGAVQEVCRALASQDRPRLEEMVERVSSKVGL
jgi:hypothetical protein